jgi:hypothetical protein
MTILSVMLISGGALAQNNDGEPKPPQALQDIVNQGAQIFFMGEFEGLNSWLMIRQGQPEYFYVDQDENFMMMGLMFNGEGQLITMAQLSGLRERVGDGLTQLVTPIEDSLINSNQPNRQSVSATDPLSANIAAMESLIEQPTPEGAQSSVTPATNNNSLATPLGGGAPALTPAQNMFVDLIEANWLTINPDGQYDMFIFIDPDCPHCKQFMVESQDFIEQGEIRLRVIPIGVNQDSVRRAALLLASGNPMDRMLRHANGDATALPVLDNISTEAVEDNAALMIKHKFDVTPVIVYRTQGQEIRLIRGRPTDYERILRDIREN